MALANIKSIIIESLLLQWLLFIDTLPLGLSRLQLALIFLLCVELLVDLLKNGRPRASCHCWHGCHSFCRGRDQQSEWG